MNAQSVSTDHSSTSTLIINPVWKREKKRPPDCCNYKTTYAENSHVLQEKRQRKLRARSTPIRRTSSMFCIILRATTHVCRLPVVKKRRRTDFFWRNNICSVSN